MKRLAAALLATVATLAVLAPISANAVATQTTPALSSTAWTDLGAGPLRLYGSGSGTRYAISDSTPAVGILGFAIGDTPIDVVSTSHVWVISADSHFNAFATYAPIASAATPTFTWPGNCGNVVIGLSPTAGCTAPVVNVSGSITASGPLGVQAITNSQSVNPATSALWQIAAASLPLPTGAATAALQPAINGDGGALAHVANFPATQPVSAAALPLPAGAAQQATLASILTNLGAAPMQATGGVVTANPPVNVAPTDCSATATGSSQILIAASATVHGFMVANIDPSTGGGEPVWISFTGAAAAGVKASFPLAAPTALTLAGMGSFTSPPGFGTNQNVTDIATSGHLISCTRW